MPTRVRKHGWALLAVLSGVLAAAPLWCSHFLPFQDAPQHLAAVAILSGRGPAAEQAQRWFEVDFAHAQYAGFYLPAAALARAVGADAAIRILLTLAALLLPLAAWMLMRAFGRDERLSLFAAPLFHTAPLYIGVYHFVAAVPVALMVIALVERQLQEPRWWRTPITSTLAVALVWMHVSGFVVAFAAACVLAATAKGAPRKRVLRGVVPLLPSVVMLALMRPPSARPSGFTALEEKGPIWQSPIDQVRDLLRFANVLPGRADEAAIAALALIWVLLAWAGLGQSRRERAWRLPLLAGGLLAAYLAAPVDIGYVAYIHLRAIPFLLMFTIGCASVPQTRLASLFLCVALAVEAGYAAVLTRAYRAFDAEANAPQLQEVLQAAEPGRRMVSLMLDRKSKAVHFEPYLHFGLYYEVLRGGRVRFNFGELPWMPLRFRGDRPAKVFPLWWEFEPGWFDWTAARGDADYVLVRTPDPEGDAADSPEPGPEFAAGWELKVRAGRWELFTPAPEPPPRRAPPTARDGARPRRSRGARAGAKL